MENGKITTVKEGCKFISQLVAASLMFHLDDDVNDILWGEDLGLDEIGLIHDRQQELWKVGNPWEYAETEINQFLKKVS